ncbi:MAG: biopolymer transporter ExbD [Firmicutes bacterium]|nr:biopolymer transporter ExbD [Bacillota bacterium]MCM1400620.1 biopolymer transporter ExbD [Bacteroides sp.]MCM1477878.1 biopolymer transporter ExbD [Bacteroides sp.]
MALKRQYDMTSIFSMASMTDVIFLLLIFFMVTSTFVFPTALEVNLPQSSEQTAIKPSTRVFVDKDKVIYVSMAEDKAEPQAVTLAELAGFVQLMRQNGAAEDFIAIYADEEVPYGTLVEILDIGSRNGLKMVLATKPAPNSAMPQ